MFLRATKLIGELCGRVLSMRVRACPCKSVQVRPSVGSELKSQLSIIIGIGPLPIIIGPLPSDERSSLRWVSLQRGCVYILDVSTSAPVSLV